MNPLPTEKPTGRIRVCIVEDDLETRECLVELLNTTDKIECLSAYSCSREALELVPKSPPDVLLMDLQLPDGRGVECVRELHRLMPDLPILMLTVVEDPNSAFEALKAGALGYLVKRYEMEKIAEAVVSVANGGAPMTAAIARLVVQSFRVAPRSVTGPVVELTKRETLVLEKIAEGLQNKEIADALKISEHTVKGHNKQIYRKLHVHTRVAAASKFRNPPPASNDGNGDKPSP